MIGMNTAIASKTGESAGVGFAIPDQHHRPGRAATDSEGPRPPARHGHSPGLSDRRGLLIVALGARRSRRNAPACKARESSKQQKRQGPFVIHATRRSTVAAADMIVAVDGRPIKTADDFLAAVEAKQPGDQVVITVIRAGQQQEIPLRLEATQ